MAEKLADALRLARADAHGLFLFLGFVQQDGHLVGAVALLGLNLHAGALRAPADELLVARRPVAAAQAAQVQRLRMLVFPWAFGPVKTVTPSLGAMSACS